MSYKRNQLEEAIARIFEPGSAAPSSELATRIKRLLDLDRSLGRDLRSKDAEKANFAFFSADAPGTGADILFSDYEAFALLNALRIMGHAWPQGFAVSALRRVRPALETEHARILKQPAKELFDQQAILAAARAGALAVSNTDPVFFVLASSAPAVEQANRGPALAVCRGLENVRKFSGEIGSSSMTMFELATIAHGLRDELLKTEPRRRGRG
jgi:hypothetical protein